MTQCKLFAPFDPTQHQPSTGGSDQLPVGKHPVVISGGEVKANKNNDGGYLQLNLQIIDGPAKGAVGPYRLNLYHNNPTTVKIANEQLTSICYVTGQFRLGADGTDVSVLFNIPFMIEVGLQKDAEAAAKGYTEVKRVYDINGNEPGKQGQQQPATTASQSGGFANPAANPQFSNPAQAANPASGFNQQPQQNAAPAWGGGQPAQPAQNQAPAQTGWSQNNNAPAGGGMPWANK